MTDYSQPVSSSDDPDVVQRKICYAVQNGQTSRNDMQTETSQYASNISSAGGYVDSQTLGVIDQFITRGKAVGWWDSLLEVYPFAGRNLASAFVKLKWTTAPSLTNVGMLSADFSQEQGFWLTSNADKHIGTGFIPNDHGMSPVNYFLAMAYQGKTGGNNLLGDQPASGSDIIEASSAGATNIGGNVINASNTNPKVIAQSGTTGATSGHFSGVRIFNSSADGSGAPLMTTEINLFRCRQYGSFFYGWGAFGTVCMGKYLSLDLASDCSLAIHELEIGLGRSGFQNQDVLGIGDSIMASQTAGSYPASWLPIAAKRLGRRELNLGMPSQALAIDGLSASSCYTARNQYAKLPQNLFFIAAGTNDTSADPTANGDPTMIANFRSKLEGLIDAQLLQGKSGIICSASYRNPAAGSLTKRRAYAEASFAAASAKNCVFVDFDRAIGDMADPADYMNDDIHPNALGHNVQGLAAAAASQGWIERRLEITLSSIPDGGTGQTSVEVLGATVDASVVVTPHLTIGDGMLVSGSVGTANNVTIFVTNVSGVSAAPVPGYYTIRVAVTSVVGQ